MSILDTPCSVLGGGSSTTLAALLGASSFALLDFWTTRCTRCPAALDKLNAAASQCGLGVQFISINLDDRAAAEVTTSQRWPNMVHVAVDEWTREALKEALQMRAVPFYVLVARDGTMLASGPPKSVPLEHLADLLNGNPENIPLAPPSPPAKKGSSGEPMQCIGGVCPLPRRTKGKTAPASPPSASGCVGGVCPLPRRPLAPRPAHGQQVAASMFAGAATPPTALAPQQQPSMWASAVPASNGFSMDEDF